MAVNTRTLTRLRRLATHVGATTDATVRQLTGEWLTAWDRLTPAWQQAIAAILDQYARTGQWPAPWQIARIEAVAWAQQSSTQSLSGLLAGAATSTGAAAAAVSAATATAEPEIIAAQLAPHQAAVIRPGVAAAVAATAVAAALASRQQRINDLHRAPLGEASGLLARVFTRPPAAADRDRAAAELAARVRAGFDTPLTRAATIARTEIVDAYRGAASAVHAAHDTVLTGWAWVCACDRRSCPACWAMHGTHHPLSEPGPLGHPGCRCTRLPLVGDNTLPSAEARFRRLSRTAQAAVLGPARLALYRAGRIGWADLAALHTTNGWRASYRARSVRDLTLLADRRAA